MCAHTCTCTYTHNTYREHRKYHKALANVFSGPFPSTHKLWGCLHLLDILKRDADLAPAPPQKSPTPTAGSHPQLTLPKDTRSQGGGQSAGTPSSAKMQSRCVKPLEQTLRSPSYPLWTSLGVGMERMRRVSEVLAKKMRQLLKSREL